MRTRIAFSVAVILALGFISASGGRLSGNLPTSFRKEDQHEKAYLAMKFVVSPDKEKDFVDAWKDMQEDVKKVSNFVIMLSCHSY